jgi:hypothetical protein
LGRGLGDSWARFLRSLILSSDDRASVPQCHCLGLDILKALRSGIPKLQYARDLGASGSDSNKTGSLSSMPHAPAEVRIRYQVGMVWMDGD